MSKSTTPSPDGSAATPARLNFLQRLESHAIRPAARDYYVRWAEAWINARGNRSAATTSAYFDALGRSTHLADWQFRQAVDAVRILAHEVLALPWAASFDWQGLANPERSLESTAAPLTGEPTPTSADPPIRDCGIPPRGTQGEVPLEPPAPGVQELLGHTHLTTTQIYLHVLNKPGLSVRSHLIPETTVGRIPTLGPRRDNPLPTPL